MKKTYQMYVRFDGSNTINIRLGEITDAKDKDTFQNVFCCHNEGVVMTWVTEKGPIPFKRPSPDETRHEIQEKKVPAKTVAEKLKERVPTVSQKTEDEAPLKMPRFTEDEQCISEKYPVIMTRHGKNTELISTVNIFQIEIPEVVRFGDIEFRQTYTNFKGAEEISISPSK